MSVLGLANSRDGRWRRPGSNRDATSRAREGPFAAGKKLERSWENQRRGRALASQSGAALSRRPLARRDSPGTGCLTIPIASSILEIEKESLPVRRLAQFTIYFLEKVVRILGRGRLLFRVSEEFHH